MFLDDLKKTYLVNKDKPTFLLRNLLKENVQYYILNFIGQSKWIDSFLFKGGTCLRIFFGLPRLSEDLDFDIIDKKKLDFNFFTHSLRDYFIKTLQFFKFDLKIANNKRVLYLKFPVLRDVGLNLKKHESNILFVRIDLAPTIGKSYHTELAIKSAHNFSFLLKRYSLPDLFAGKISAILAREAFEGRVKKERFKGRDYYDLIWFIEKGIKPNWKYLKELTGFAKEEIIRKLDNKTKKISLQVLRRDLLPFFADPDSVETFAANFQSLYKNYKKNF